MEFFQQITLYRDVIQPILDILFLTFIIYNILKLLIDTKSTHLAYGLGLLFLIYAIATFFNLKTNIWILNGLATVLVIIIAIVFQPELRKIFAQIGRSGFSRHTVKHKFSHIEVLLDAAEYLSSIKRGALIVIERKVSLKNFTESATILDADISFNLITTIFEKDTPMHDGAIIINNGKISAAGCYLPLTEQYDIKKSFGTRHRAALGVTENSDCAVIIVSEETSAISIAYNSSFQYDLNRNELVKSLTDILEFVIDEHEDKGAENEV